MNLLATDNSVEACVSLVYTAVVSVSRGSKTHCVSESTEELIPDPGP